MYGQIALVDLTVALTLFNSTLLFKCLQNYEVTYGSYIIGVLVLIKFFKLNGRRVFDSTGQHPGCEEHDKWQQCFPLMSNK